MTSAFGREYSDSYDALYADKDYAAECDLLEDVFRAHSRPVASVLDLGCGTGRHSIELARRGYSVVGVDLSEAMLELARGRLPADLTDRVRLVQGDMAEVRIDRRFDAVVCMFAALGYQIEDGPLTATLDNVRRHLEPGGVFAFDVWYGPAVEAVGPTARVKVVETATGRIERRAVGALEAGRNVCTVQYDLVHSRPGEPDALIGETHRMRYFDEAELRARLGAAGLRLESLSAFPDVQNPPSNESWNVFAVAVGGLVGAAAMTRGPML